MNPLQQIPPTVRKWIYLGYALALLVLGALQVGYGSADAVQPTWLDVAFDVTGYLGLALGLTAASNLPSYQDVAEGDAPAPPLERGAFSLQTAVLLLVAVAAVVIIIAFVNVNVR